MEKKASWIVTALSSACTGLVGVLITLGAVVGECKTTTIEVTHLKARVSEQQAQEQKDLQAVADQIKSDRESLDRRMGMVIGLIEESNKTLREVISLDKEVITLLKLQNGMDPRTK